MSLAQGTLLAKPSLRLSRRAELSFSIGSLALLPRRPSLVAFAASRQESKHTDPLDKEKNNLKRGCIESEEAWQQTLDAFNGHASKMKSISEEAYRIYSRKALLLCTEIAELLKIQAVKARYDLTVLAEEISDEGKDYMSAAAENTPQHLKEIVETFSSPTDDLSDVSRVRDFYIGVPYGLLLSLGGFLSFMVTGSIAAIRFGVILGGTFLALSISSLRSYRRGQSDPLVLKGQAGIAAILFLREAHLFSQRPSLWSFMTAVISGAIVAFYLYRITRNGESKRSSH